MNTLATSATPAKIRVWDLPTRIFHWALAICVMGLVVSGLSGGGAMEWHMRMGYCVLVLLIFRIVWGFVGGYWSRFVQFAYAPWTILTYLRGKSVPSHDIGHNPLGSLSVWALLLILSLQVATGLVSDDEIATQGLLAKFVSSANSLLATGYHKHWGKWIILGLVVLHIGAILFYVFKKKQNLLKPMLVGDKVLAIAVASPTTSSIDGTAQRVTALSIFLAIAAAVYYVVQRLG